MAGPQRPPDTVHLLAEYLGGASYAAIGRRHGMAMQSVWERIERLARLLDCSVTELHAYREHEAEIMDAARFQALRAALDPTKLEKASTKELAIAGAIWFDKARLLRGQSTQNVSSRVDAVLTAHMLATQPTTSPHVPAKAIIVETQMEPVLPESAPKQPLQEQAHSTSETEPTEPRTQLT